VKKGFKVCLRLFKSLKLFKVVSDVILLSQGFSLDFFKHKSRKGAKTQRNGFKTLRLCVFARKNKAYSVIINLSSINTA
jgi:hypothetical protein